MVIAFNKFPFNINFVTLSTMYLFVLNFNLKFKICINLCRFIKN